MSTGLYNFLAIDLPAMLTGVLAALVCGLLGNFLILRRQALMGDAIAHAVLPGLVAGFLITGSRATLPMFVGAAVAGGVTAVLIELVRKAARLESGAAMGVVFATMFALGVVLIEQAAARGVDLDADCVLSGQLERVFWILPKDAGELFTWRTLSAMPRELATLAGVFALAGALVAMFFKELRLACFDPDHARSIGVPAGAIHLGLVLGVAVAVVASFEAVGSILVVAMLVCPAATARLLTDRLSTQVWLSLVVAASTAASGYMLAAHGPATTNLGGSLSAAGTMAVTGGIALALAVFFGPTHGVVARWRRQRLLSRTVAREDLLASLYRAEERASGIADAEVRAAHAADERARREALARGEIRVEARGAVLTETGRARALELVRAHRLWETYLVEEVGLRPDHVHARAAELEHVTDPALAQSIARSSEAPRATDPHGRPIPPIDR